MPTCKVGIDHLSTVSVSPVVHNNQINRAFPLNRTLSLSLNKLFSRVILSQTIFYLIDFIENSINIYDIE